MHDSRSVSWNQNGRSNENTPNYKGEKNPLSDVCLLLVGDTLTYLGISEGVLLLGRD